MKFEGPPQLQNKCLHFFTIISVRSHIYCESFVDKLEMQVSHSGDFLSERMSATLRLFEKKVPEDFLFRRNDE